MESYAERECVRVKPILVHGNNGPKSHLPGKRNERDTEKIERKKRGTARLKKEKERINRGISVFMLLLGF